MQRVEAIIRPERLEPVKVALEAIGFNGLNVTHVTGRGVQRGVIHGARGEEMRVDMLPKIRLEVVVKDSDVDKVIDVIITAARTGSIGDGKIFVSPVVQAIRVRTGERGDDAI